MRVTVVKSSMSLLDLLQFLTLFIREIGSHLLVRLGHNIVHAPPGVSPNVSELRCRVVDNRRNFGDLFRRQVEIGAEPLFHPRADPFRVMKFKEKMPGIRCPEKCAANCPGEEHENESRNEFPSQHAVHFKNSS